MRACAPPGCRCPTRWPSVRRFLGDDSSWSERWLAERAAAAPPCPVHLAWKGKLRVLVGVGAHLVARRFPGGEVGSGRPGPSAAVRRRHFATAARGAGSALCVGAAAGGGACASLLVHLEALVGGALPVLHVLKEGPLEVVPRGTQCTCTACGCAVGACCRLRIPRGGEQLGKKPSAPPSTILIRPST